MLAKKLKVKIGQDKRIILDVSDIPQGEVDIIILKKRERVIPSGEILSGIPKHRVGKILSALGREEIYADAR